MSLEKKVNHCVNTPRPPPPPPQGAPLCDFHSSLTPQYCYWGLYKRELVLMRSILILNTCWHVGITTGNGAKHASGITMHIPVTPTHYLNFMAAPLSAHTNHFAISSLVALRKAPFFYPLLGFSPSLTVSWRWWACKNFVGFLNNTYSKKSTYAKISHKGPLGISAHKQQVESGKWVKLILILICIFLLKTQVSSV